jgi:hypothetical protein
MGQTSGKPGGFNLNPFKVLRDARDAGLGTWAKIVLGVTSSRPYSRASSALAKPGLMAAALARRKTDQAMSQLLSHVNMPSRADVLSLSVRLTHIEMALDDLSAAIEAMRAPGARSHATTKRSSGSDGAPRRPTSTTEG